MRMSELASTRKKWFQIHKVGLGYAHIKMTPSRVCQQPGLVEPKGRKVLECFFPLREGLPIRSF